MIQASDDRDPCKPDIFQATYEPACRVCDGSGKLTVPDGDGESASEQACPDPIHDRQPAPESAADMADVHVDWHMTPAEWGELRGILLRNTGYEYIGRLEASGALGTASAKPAPDPRVHALDPALVHKDLLELTETHDNLLHAILLPGIDPCDSDQDGDELAVRYVRDLEAERDRLAAITGGTVTIDGQTFPQPTPAPDCTVCAELGGPHGVPQPAPELAAMGETRQVRGAMETLLSLFRPTSQGWVARTSGGRLRRLAQSAGVTPPDVTTNHGDVPDEAEELREQLTARTALLATVLGEFTKSSDGCHARISQVTLAKRKQAAGMPITEAERKMIGA